ncbi:hypothetical protein FJR38_20110 [Anabaena sp. UHCC 0253]|uniref:hypothetical protein n=1 Tax=Anabaena sp. UHCC 0253 TaxID=2590019 RepID=UPI0014456B87|nr:hypothetical protein [Anabaena sp. UHCC 0253]MTJ54803.1 hypothetical protein [Anabaena sp. UHCC 0253]
MMIQPKLIFSIFSIITFWLIYQKFYAVGLIESCFSPVNFDKALRYIRWKDPISKIGKILVNGYIVKVNEENEIVFKNKKETYTVFKVNRERGITIVSIKSKR